MISILDTKACMFQNCTAIKVTLEEIKPRRSGASMDKKDPMNKNKVQVKDFIETREKKSLLMASACQSAFCAAAKFLERFRDFIDLCRHLSVGSAAGSGTV